ncbi:MAG TPA: hydroxyphenylacetyl-CoA thioesterase PaaI [Gemmatimonadaceae bacterium]|nr:hydroxyphenylacetyl-CoA thioesterase PaaI [Gemmatimonadaceae bacterium]
MSDAAESERRLAERVVEAMTRRDGFSAWLGVEVVEIRPRACTARLTVRREMLNGFGVCHGGIAFSLADSALAFASNTHGRVTVSIENSITYPAPVREGDVLTAVAEQESAANRLAFFRVPVTKQDGSIVALFRGTVYKTSREFFPGEGE